MKVRNTAFIALCLLTAVASAQDRTQRTEVYLQNETVRDSYFEFRFGAWFQRDKEKSFTLNDVSYDAAKSKISQSQAIGLDIHYRNEMTKPMFFDFSLGGWYSSYTFQYTGELSDLNLIQNADSWVVIVPITIGLSVAPIPQGPLQPYGMIGVGVYPGVSGLSQKIGDNSTHKDDKFQLGFGGYLGAGLDFLFTPSFGLSAAAKYQFLQYKEYFHTMQKVFTGLQISIGFASKL